MARTDDDSWDIIEGVGQTALGVAWSRSEESTSDHPLFTDPYARLFVAALMTRYGRCTPEQDEATIPRSVFIEGHLVC